MSKEFLIYCEGDGQTLENAVTYFARDSEEAAEKWALCGEPLGSPDNRLPIDESEILTVVEVESKSVLQIEVSIQQSIDIYTHVVDENDL